MISSASALAPSLHTPYQAGEPSACPHHVWCCYLGTEPDRCPVCHALWVVIVRRPENYGGGTPRQHLRVHEDRQARRSEAVKAAWSGPGGAARREALVQRNQARAAS